MIGFQLESILKWKRDLVHLIYPDSCLICEKELSQQQKFVCSFCKDDFQYTYFERYEEPTPLDQLFWGRVPVHATFAYLYFEKEKSIQPVLHTLKYKDRPELGVEMGALMAEVVKEIPAFQDVDALIPVPLHPKKEFKRGYNQSEKIADGIASILSIPVLSDFVQRQKNTDSQTKKGRFMRWDNVENKFRSSKNTPHKHIALVDDVITTGATLEAIIRMIQENNPEIRVSVLSLALTK